MPRATPEDARLNELAREYARSDSPETRGRLRAEICIVGRAYVERVVGRGIKSRHHLLTRGDYVQQGWIELLRQLERYDPEAGAPFTGYCFARLHGSPTDLNRTWTRYNRRTGESMEAVSGDAPDPDTDGLSLFESLGLADPLNEHLSVESDRGVRVTVAEALTKTSTRQALALLLWMAGVEDAVTARLLETTTLTAVRNARSAMKGLIRRALERAEPTA